MLASRFPGIPKPDLAQALVTEYAPGAGIGWHRDKPMFQDVVALSFLTPCVLRLRRAADAGWERAAVEIAPRSGYPLPNQMRTQRVDSLAPTETVLYSSQ